MIPPEEIPVFLATDDNYAKYAAVVIKSVSQNTKSKPVFCVLTKGLQEDNKRKIAESADGNRVRFFDIDASMFEGFKVDVT